MSYATPAQFLAEVAVLDLDDVPETTEGVQALLDRASADLDQFLRFPASLQAVGDPVPSTRMDPANMNAWEAFSMKRACIAQASYRLIVSEEALIEGKPTVQVAGQVTFSREAPDLLSSMALVCLAGIPTLWRNASGCAPPPPLLPAA